MNIRRVIEEINRIAETMPSDLIRFGRNMPGIDTSPRRATYIPDELLDALNQAWHRHDTRLRADADGAVVSSRAYHPYACLAHEVQSALNELGIEETLNVVMTTIYNERKHKPALLQLKSESHSKPASHTHESRADIMRQFNNKDE